MSKPKSTLKGSHTNADGQSLIYIYVYVGGSQVFIPSDIYVLPENFDKKTGLITKGADKTEKNNLIKEAVGRAADIILRYKVLKQDLTKEIFIKEFKNPAVVMDFYEFMRDEIYNRTDIGDSTRNLHLSVLSKLKQFKTNCLMSEMDESYLRSYHKFLKSKYKNMNNTVGKDMRILRTYVNKAIRMEYIKKNPFKYYKIKREKTYPVFLDDNEMDKLLQIYNSGKLPLTYHTTLRQFLFCCFTGLRVSDLKVISYEQIQNGMLEYIPVKGRNTSQILIRLPLSRTALKLIADENGKDTGTIFEHPAASKLNKNMKDIAIHANISKDISIHVARHTFATRFLRKCKNANGVVMLQKLLGHTSLATTMVYTHVLDSDVRNAIVDFDS